MFNRLRPQVGRLVRFQNQVRTQMYQDFGALEHRHKIPNNFGYTSRGATTWSFVVMSGLVLYCFSNILPFSLVRHIRVTFKEARVSEWYMTQYGNPIEKKVYAKWEEED